MKKIVRALALGLMLSALQAHAQPALDGRLLGISEAELQATFTTLNRVKKPLLGPHGVRGLWALPNTTLAGVLFETTFYLRDKHVTRIEQLRQATGQVCRDESEFSALVSSLKIQYGAGIMSSDPADNQATQRAAVWEVGASEVRALFSPSPNQCSIRVIYTAHLEKDASEL